MFLKGRRFEMERIMLYPLIIPMLLGIVCFILPRSVKYFREALSFLGALGMLVLGVWMFMNQPLTFTIHGSDWLVLDRLSGFIILATGVFGFLVTLYSLSFMAGSDKGRLFYGALLWTLGAAAGVILCNHLIGLLLFWGFLGITLYLLILSGGGLTADAAKKALIIIGGSDALMLLGIGFIYSLTGTFFLSGIRVVFGSVLSYSAFLLLALGVFAKIGAIPLHTWIPDMAERAPVPASAFLPGSLDKLLGIYLLTRISMGLFEMTGSMNLVLLIVGSITVMVSVMMGLHQNDGKKMVGYLVITGAGYMLIGMGTGNPVGMAGGLFYMISSALWTQCLFFSIGCVEHRAGTTEFGKLGGLVRNMPLSFSVTLLAVLAISGIPPLNGFASKWMIYQGLIELGSVGSKVWVIWLASAMFGSALTLAIGVKLLHTVFLGPPLPSLEKKKIRDVGGAMAIPMIVLVLLCAVFGIFAYGLPLKQFIAPLFPNLSYIGLWSPGTATILILVGLGVGFIIYMMGNLKGIREANVFLGGEKLSEDERVTGTGFYDTVREHGLLHRLYAWAEAKWFDVYDQGMRLGEVISHGFKKAHTGVLNTYLLWVMIGLAILLIILM